MTALQVANLDRIAMLELHEVPVKQIAMAVGISEDRLAEVTAGDQYKALLAGLVGDNIEQAELVNSGWDAVEEASLTVVAEHLATVPDPEYALKAAAVANKAARRNHVGNKPIVGQAGVRSVINLNVSFVDKLQQNFSVAKRGSIDAIAKKDENALSPKGVELLLKPMAKQLEEEIETLDFDLVPA